MSNLLISVTYTSAHVHILYAPLCFLANTSCYFLLNGVELNDFNSNVESRGNRIDWNVNI